jgi:hypothetical protein
MAMLVLGLILASWSGLDYQATLDLAAIQGSWYVVGLQYAGLDVAEPLWQFSTFVVIGIKKGSAIGI